MGSLMTERYNEKGLAEATLDTSVTLIKSRGINQKPVRPKRSPQSLVSMRELGGHVDHLAAEQYEKMCVTRAEKQLKLVASFKRGSGDVNALQFAPNSLRLASIHTTKCDAYNEPGNFLICDVGLKGWADNNEGSLPLNIDIVRMMSDSRNGVEGFAHTFSDEQGRGIPFLISQKRIND
jgi:hypothetical protein